ncbi:MAG: DUF3179 domain-containing protein [Gemmatimonadota bacterium]
MRQRRILTTATVLGATAFLSASALGVGSGTDARAQSIPLAEQRYVLGDEIATYNGFIMSGGPPPDGIPSIDSPQFVNASAARLAPGDLVIGYYHRGEARAYPQKILVHHEIVNDQVGGLNMAITYCPLTATAQGFERGTTTLGVSGQLLNSNLVMYDRESGSLFSQIAATGLRGDHHGRSLVEVNLIWTTWERWRSKYPETRVLSERTGHLRNYTRDPYGSYNPLGGYYSQQGTIFPLLHTSRNQQDKEMVVGARTAERSAYFVMADLARERILRTENFLAVYDSELDTGHIYLIAGETPDLRALSDGAYEIGGERYRPDELPLEEAVSIEAFFFAWNAFYPQSESPGRG